MNVYYRRIITWQKWPDNDCVEDDYVSYSLSNKKWNEFYRTPPLADQAMRKKLVATKLQRKVKNIDLVKS